MSQKNYDLLVIGAGSVGQSVAQTGAQAGRRTAIIEGRAYGGTCPLRGCDPKLVLHAAAETMHRVHRLSGKGFTSSPGFSWPDLMDWKKSFTNPIPEKSRDKMQEAGVDTYADYATFEDAHTLRVGEDRLRGETIAIATGMRPAPLNIPGSEYLLTSDDFLSMPDLPAEMVIVGGGYIGSETAHICQALGCRVTLIVSEEVPLDKFDHDLADLLRQSDEERGMKIHLNSKATAVDKRGDRFAVTVAREAGDTQTVLTDRVIHCAGRIPNIDRLDLDQAGVRYGKKGIEVDDQLRTSVDHIYAVGDCAASGLPLTPVGTYAASLLNENLFEGAGRQVDYYPIPTVAFCLPGIASVGMTAAEAKDAGDHIEARYEVATDWYYPRHLNASVYAFKLFIDSKKQVVVGAHLLGPDATELINLFYLAIRREIPIPELKDMIFAYPTPAAVLQSMLAA
jgi:glutathione reductase (NADPH)